MWDNPTPKFSTLRNRGLIINTAMKQIQQSTVKQTRPMRLLSAVNDTGHYNSHAGPPSLGISIPDDVAREIDTARTLAATQARSRVASPEAMSGVSYAERRETFGMLRKPVDMLVNRTETLEKLVRKLKRRGANRPQIMAEVANWWLLFRYGIIPLIYDVEGTLKALRAQDRLVRETSRGKHKAQVQTSVESVSNTLWWGDRYTTQVSTIWDISCRAGVLHEYESTLQRRLGLTIYDLPATALETVTLSFVLNWFSNTSEFIASCSADFRSDVKAQWVTTDVEMSRTSVLGVTIVPNDTRSVLLEDPSGATTSEFYHLRQRDPMTAFDTGIRSRVSMSQPRIADAFALVYGRLLGNLRR